MLSFEEMLSAIDAEKERRTNKWLQQQAAHEHSIDQSINLLAVIQKEDVPDLVRVGQSLFDKGFLDSMNCSDLGGYGAVNFDVKKDKNRLKQILVTGICLNYDGSEGKWKIHISPDSPQNVEGRDPDADSGMEWLEIRQLQNVGIGFTLQDKDEALHAFVEDYPKFRERLDAFIQKEILHKPEEEASKQEQRRTALKEKMAKHFWQFRMEASSLGLSAKEANQMILDTIQAENVRIAEKAR